MILLSKVHVTSQTLELLNGEYEYESGSEAAKHDAFLLKNNIETFLISPKPKTVVDDVNKLIMVIKPSLVN